MNSIPTPKKPRILAIAPTSKGFGFAVLDAQNILVTWGVKVVRNGGKNNQCFAKIEKMIADYQPNVIALEQTSDFKSKRAPRIKALTKRIVALAAQQKLKVASFSQEEIRNAFFRDGIGTKHALAEIVANEFPDELLHYLPPKRRAWESEHYKMGIFDAVALVFMAKPGIKRQMSRNC